ncbi:MAG: sulfotransferase domain-containing protein [Parvularculaceae bacterium]
MNLPLRAVKKARLYLALRAASKDAAALLVSYRKSGRTWLRYILSHYFNDVCEVGETINFRTIFRITPNLDLDPERGVRFFESGPARGKAPLVLVTHRRPNPFIMGAAPVVFLIRDPRDVMVSAYHHAVGHKGVFKGDIDEFLDNPDIGVDDLSTYLSKWAAALRTRSHVIVAYEDLSADPVPTLTNVIEFLGLTADRSRIEAAVAASSFDKMLDDEIKTGIPGHAYDAGAVNSRRVRKGKVGGYVDELTQEQASGIMVRLEKNLGEADANRRGLDRYLA